VGVSLHVVYNALVLARVTTLGLVALGAEAVRLVGVQMRRWLVPVCRKWGPGITGGMVDRKVPKDRCTIPTPGVTCTVLWKDERLWKLDSGCKSIEVLWN